MASAHYMRAYPAFSTPARRDQISQQLPKDSMPLHTLVSFPKYSSLLSFLFSFFFFSQARFTSPVLYKASLFSPLQCTPSLKHKPHWLMVDDGCSTIRLLRLATVSLLFLHLNRAGCWVGIEWVKGEMEGREPILHFQSHVAGSLAYAFSPHLNTSFS